MNLFHVSFQRKLIVLASTIIPLATSCVGLSLYEWRQARAARVRELTLLASALAANTAASVALSDPQTAGDTLESLRADHDIVVARLYDHAGRIFAEYVRADLPQSFVIPPRSPDNVTLRGDSLILTLPVSFHGQRNGSIVVIADVHSLNEKLWAYVRITALLLVAAVLTIYLVCSRMLSLALQPILQLAEIAQKVSSEGDYSLRALTGQRDEIGTLIYSFNDMLDGIQQRDNALQSANDELEMHVVERTAALEKEIAERRQVESELRWKTAFLEAQVNSTVDGILVVSPGKQKLLQNRRLNEMWNVPQRIADSSDDRSLFAFVLSLVTDPEQFQQKVQYLYEHPEETSRDEIEFADGMVFERHSAPVHGQDGHYYGRLWTFRDITDRKHNEQALRHAKEALSKERQVLRALIDNVPDYMYVKDAQGRYVVANVALPRALGLHSPDELLGKRLPDCYPGTLPPTYCEDEQAIIATKKPVFNREEEYVNAAGKHLCLLNTKVPVFNSDGEVVGIAGVALNITDRKKTEDTLRRTKEALQKERQVLRTLIDNVPDFMYVKDTEGRYLVANTAVARNAGVATPEHLLGKTVFDFFPEPVAKSFAEDDRKLLLSKEPLLNSEEHVFNGPDGDPIWVLTTKVPLFDDKGQVIGLAGIGRDITTRKRAELEWQRAKEAAEAASRAKSEFLANMSHEIRTPLNGIIGMTDLTLDNVTAEQREYLEAVKLSADSLLVVINDILDYSKVEAGKLELELTDFHLRNCVETTLKTLALRADEKGLELLYHVLPGTPEFLSGDPNRLRQILINLVGNAIKFTHHGHVQVDVALYTPGSEDHLLHFVVSDTGIGIPSDKQALIFQPFSQADSSTTRKYGGTGLGLTISTRLISLMGGRIWLESEPGHGSRFHFTILFKPATSKPEPVLASAPLAARVAKPRPGSVGSLALSILVAEDNAVNQRLILRMLEKRGHRAKLAGNGREVLQFLERESFDLVLMDIQMPEMDGLATAMRIRELEKTSGTNRHLLIIALTAHAMKGDRERCLAAGMDGYLAKPIRPAELDDLLASHLASHPSLSTEFQAPDAQTIRH